MCTGQTSRENVKGSLFIGKDLRWPVGPCLPYNCGYSGDRLGSIFVTWLTVTATRCHLVEGVLKYI